MHLAGLRRVVDGAMLVDDALLQMAAHAATAERMHRQQRPSRALHERVHRGRQKLPEWIRHHAATEVGSRGKLGQLSVLRFEQGLAHEARPAYLQLAVALQTLRALGQVQPALGTVVAHHRERQRALKSLWMHGTGVGHRMSVPMARAIHRAQRLQCAGGGEHLRGETPEDARHREVFDDDALRRALTRQADLGIDDAGDGRADLAARGRRVFVGDALGRRVEAIAEAEHVAIAREALAQARGESERRGALRAQQELGGTEAPRRDDDAPCQQRHRPALAAVQHLVGVARPDLPELLRIVALQPQHGRTAIDLGTVTAREREQVGVERFLGAIVAAARAVAAAPAGCEPHAADGDLLRHRHGDGRRAVARVVLRQAETLHQPRLGQRGSRFAMDVVVAAIVRRAEQTLGALVVLGPTRIVAPADRPAGIEDLGARNLHHTGVDQGAAAEPVGEHHVEITADAQVEQTLAAAADAGKAATHGGRQFGEA